MLSKRLGFDPETTLHDVRYGEEYGGEFVWVFEISGSVPPNHLTGGFKGAVSTFAFTRSLSHSPLRRNST